MELKNLINGGTGKRNKTNQAVQLKVCVYIYLTLLSEIMRAVKKHSWVLNAGLEVETFV